MWAKTKNEMTHIRVRQFWFKIETMTMQLYREVSLSLYHSISPFIHCVFLHNLELADFF